MGGTERELQAGRGSWGRGVETLRDTKRNTKRELPSSLTWIDTDFLTKTSKPESPKVWTFLRPLFF